MLFVIALRPTSEGFEIEVPQIPGFRMRGATVDEVKRAAQSAIAERCAELARDGLPMPTPGALGYGAGMSDDDTGVFLTALEVPVEHLFTRQAL